MLRWIITASYIHLNSIVIDLGFSTLNWRLSFRTLTLMFLFLKALFLNLILSIEFSKHHILRLLLLDL